MLGGAHLAVRRDRDDLRWPVSLGPVLAGLLVHIPVRAHRTAGGFHHPPDPFHVAAADVAGLVTAAWSDAGGVYVQLALADEVVWLRRGLLAMARDGQLHRIEISPVLPLSVAHTEEIGRPVRCVRAVQRSGPSIS